MDPATVGGLAIGAVSLLFDVFDNSVKIFKFLSCMVAMPRDCEQCRLRLVIEYNRLLAWGKAVGLMDVTDEPNVATTLGTDTVELCGIISRIGWLLGEFKDINARWEKEMNADAGQNSNTDCDNHTIDNSGLDVAYEKVKERRKQLRRTSHIVRWISSRIGEAKEIASHPYRVRWAIVDKEAFEALLKDLHDLVARLHQLVGDYSQKQIHDVTVDTYRELVITRNTVSELRDMIGAVTAWIASSKDNSASPMGSQIERNYEFYALLELKKLNRAADDILLYPDDKNGLHAEEAFAQLISVEKVDGSTLGKRFTYTQPGGVSFKKLARARGVFVRESESMEAWIEWRSNDGILQGSFEDKVARFRVMALAQLLSNKKPQSLSIPDCIGYVDDVGLSGRYGWIFSMPKNSCSDTTLRSLNDLLGQARYKPTLVQRMALAWKLASTLLCLHTANWLHKGIHSGNVIFTFNGDQYDASRPTLSGFDYARPETGKTTTRSLEPKWDIYRWPGIQGEAPRATTSRKTYDTYSLGLVLLEIAHWKPLHKLMNMKKWPQPSAQDSRIREWLLKEDPYATFTSDPLHELRDIAGDRYWRAVVRCITAHGEDGLHVGETAHQTLDTGVGLKLLDAFNKLVVQELEAVSV